MRNIFARGVVLNGPLVAVGVIFIIAVGLIIALDPLTMIAKKRDAARIEALHGIQARLEEYYDDFGEYPRSSAEYLIFDQQTKRGVEWGKNWTTYATPLPQDPEGDRRFVYVASARNNFQSYGLYAAFSFPEEVGAVCISDDGVCARVPEGVLCGEVACTGGVGSPNSSP